MPPTPSDSPAPAALPEQFGPYRIVKRLGQGGMGTVYLARDTRLNREVALKVCSVTTNPRARERFRREAQAAAKLRHPNLCPVHEFDERDGLAYLTMAFIAGPTLDRWVRERPLSPREAALLVAKLARAMQAAHDGGVIHRDLKPANIAFEKDEPVILDFGLARQTDDSRSRLTHQGQILGTPSYMAPEQIGGDPEQIGPGADVYSLGVILYELLTGDVPFRGPLTAVLGQALHTPPKPPRERNPAVDARLEAVCLTALAKKPAERFPTMTAFADALAKCGKKASKTTRSLPPPLPGPTETLSTQRGSLRTATLAPVRRGWGTLALALLLVTGLVAAAWVGIVAWQRRPTKTQGSDGTPAKEFTNSVGMDFVFIKPGRFQMGSPTSELKRGDNEKRHEVTLTKGFHMGTTLVSQRQWKAVMGADNNPSKFKGDDLPVDTVTWYDAVDYCNRLSAKEGKRPCYRLDNVKREDGAIKSADVEILADGTGYRLPREAEWEYAARAGTTTPFWQGETITTDEVNFDGNNRYRDGEAAGEYRKTTTTVKQFKPNPWGLYDMGGNLYQWCEDWYGEYPDGPIEDHKGLQSGKSRVLRGGSWGDDAGGCRAALRYSDDPGYRSYVIGFRVVLSSGARTP